MHVSLLHLSLLINLCRGFKSDDSFITDILNTWDVRHCDVGYVYGSLRPKIPHEIIAITKDRFVIKHIFTFHSFQLRTLAEML